MKYLVKGDDTEDTIILLIIIDNLNNDRVLHFSSDQAIVFVKKVLPLKECHYLPGVRITDFLTV
jgi:hypothetical protein